MTHAEPTETLDLRTGVQRLEQSLNEEIRQYETIVEKLHLKKEILIAGTPQPLIQVDQELQALSRKALQLEKHRLALQAQLGYPACPLRDFIAQLPPDQAPALNRCRERLLRAVQDMHRLNQEAGELLDLSIRWIRDTVELIAGALTPEGSSYNAHGSKAHATNPGAAMAPVQSTIIRSA